MTGAEAARNIGADVLQLPPVAPADASGRRRGRWIAGGVALLVIAAIAVVAMRGGSSSVGTAEEIRSNVEVRTGAGEFVPVREHPKVSAGDLLRTDKTGRGRIDYGDGSRTLLEPNTSFEIQELSTGSRRVMSAKLDVGRVWSSVEKLASSEDRFEIVTPNAVATVKGTDFGCMHFAVTTCMQVTGRTEVVWNNGVKKTLTAGQCSTEGGECQIENWHKLFNAIASDLGVDGFTPAVNSQNGQDPIGPPSNGPNPGVSALSAGPSGTSGGPPDTPNENEPRTNPRDDDEDDEDGDDEEPLSPLNQSPQSNQPNGNDNNQNNEEPNNDEGDNDEGDNDEGDNDEGDNDEGDNDEGDNDEGENDEEDEGDDCSNKSVRGDCNPGNHEDPGPGKSGGKGNPE